MQNKLENNTCYRVDKVDKVDKEEKQQWNAPF